MNKFYSYNGNAEHLYLFRINPATQLNILYSHRTKHGMTMTPFCLSCCRHLVGEVRCSSATA